MYNTRKEIKNYLELSHRLHKAMQEILNDYQLYEKVAEKYNLDNSSLNTKISLFPRYKKYLEEKPRFEKAIDDLVSKNKTLKDAAEENKVNEKELLKEHTKCRRLKNITEYKYDILSETNGIFTFMEELSLLKRLHSWKKKCKCLCQICALQQLLRFSFHLAQQKNKQYPETWVEHKQADLNWMYKFIMKYIEEISEFELICKLKIKYRPLRELTESSSSRTFVEQKILQPSTSYTHMQENMRPSQSSNIPKTSDSKRTTGSRSTKQRKKYYRKTKM